MAKLEKITKEEKYFDDVKTEYDQLKSKLDAHKKDDLKKFKNEILILLESEIISRYYYQTGTIAYSIKNDPQIDSAIKTINDIELYRSILAGIKK